MVRKIKNIDNHHLRKFFKNIDEFAFLIKITYNYNYFFPVNIVYHCRDFFFLRFFFYYNNFVYFVSLISSFWRVSELQHKSIDNFIFLKHIWYKQSKFFCLDNLHFIQQPLINKKIPFRFIFLLLNFTNLDYRTWFAKGLQNKCRFKFQKLFNIYTEFTIVFRDYHSKYKDELYFERKYESYLPLLKKKFFMFDNLEKFKQSFLDYFKQRKFLIFIKIRNFFNKFLQTFLPAIGVFKFSEKQLTFIYLLSLLLRMNSVVKSYFFYKDKIFLSKKNSIAMSREPLVVLFEVKLKKYLSFKTFLMFRFIINESSDQNIKRRYRKATKILRVIRTYRFIKKLVIWNFKIFKRMFNLLLWWVIMMHFIECLDYFIEFHIFTDERVFILIYGFLKRKYQEVYDFFFTFY